MKKIFALALLLVLSVNTYSQLSKTHYIPPLTAPKAGETDPREQVLMISTPSTTSVNLKITPIGGAVINTTVINGTPYVLVINSRLDGMNPDTQLFVPALNCRTIQTNKGYIIEADKEVYANVRVVGEDNYHAGGLVCKGTKALGKEFRLGTYLNPYEGDSKNNSFAGILATEDNTTVIISNLGADARYADDTKIPNPLIFTLNKNESYVLNLGNYDNNDLVSNQSKMVGGLVQSDKPVAINCGSFAGSNENTTNGRDVGFDQIVSYEKTGKEYIFVKGNGTDANEKVLLIANRPNTVIYTNGNSIPVATLASPGQFVALDGTYFSNGNLYVTSSEAVFAYQNVSASIALSYKKTNMFFVPPINCATPKTVDQIPYIDRIDPFETDFSDITKGMKLPATINIVTEAGSTVKLNGNILISTTAVAVVGKTSPNFVRYTVSNQSGHIKIESTSQVYVSYNGLNNDAAYGGYYSGFDTQPVLYVPAVVNTTSPCIPTATITETVTDPSDTFTWYKNTSLDNDPTSNVIVSGNTNTLQPSVPGYYTVQRNVTGCTSPLLSNSIPISTCATNMDSDLANDNFDVDHDNDGIPNSIESYGNIPVNISNTGSGIITAGSGAYTNNFTGTIGFNNVAASITGSADGSFIASTPAGSQNTVSYQMDFAQPISIGIDYPATTAVANYLTFNAEYTLNSDIGKTLTVKNPSGQLLIDTNYDGIYESGVTEFTGFEIRFKISGTTPLSPVAADFEIAGYLVNTIKFTQRNLSFTSTTNSSLRIFADSVPLDSDGDGKADQVDTDSDNDGILDITEAQVNAAVAASGVDVNKDGMDDAFGIAGAGFTTPVNTDLDSVPDYLDLDSDNDGILDSVETGATGTDSDTDGIKNYRELDSDNDGCVDVIEAGFTDPDGDGKLGTSPVTIDTKGKVTNGTDGYTAPNNIYTKAATVTITGPLDVYTDCGTQTAILEVKDNDTNTPSNKYKWEVSTDNGFSWTTVVNGSTNSGANTNKLTVTSAINGDQYRVEVSNINSACPAFSNTATLSISGVPVITNVTMEQCGTNLSGKAEFDLTSKNPQISADYGIETFTYYTTQAGAAQANPAFLIPNHTQYINATPYTMDVFARVVNAALCASVAKISLTVGVVIAPTDTVPTGPAPICDDNHDGIAAFNLTATKAAYDLLFPATGYNVVFYPDLASATAQTGAITNLVAYNNTDPLNPQPIYVRVNNTNPIFNTCYTLDTYFNLTVLTKPTANPVTIAITCDDDIDGITIFNTSALESTLIGTTQTGMTATYFDAAGSPLKDANGVLITGTFPNTFKSKSQTIKAVVTNNTTGCSDFTNIVFTVEAKPIAYPVTITNTCDVNGTGIAVFDTSSLEDTLLGTAQAGKIVTYFDAAGNPLQDANGVFITSKFPNTFESTSQTIKAVVTNNTPQLCNSETMITFTVNVVPTANPVTTTTSLIHCDDELDPLTQDGKYSFFTTSIESEILLGQTGMNVKYYDQSNNLFDPLPNPYNSGTQIVSYVVENTLNTNCTASGTFSFTVNPLPRINTNTNGNEDTAICTNLPTATVNLNAGIQDGSPISNYTYQWYLDGGILTGETSYDLMNIITPGTYTVDVTNTTSLCPSTRIIEVRASDIANIKSINIVDLTDINTVTVKATGTGDYEYTIDDTGYQNSNFFNNVASGTHTITVNDKNGCGAVYQMISVLGAPKFFTPNGDGYNDYWNIVGLRTSQNQNSIIYVFDRYGKLIKQLTPYDKGWDGTLNGFDLPSNDYWFKANLQDGREAKGHFSLKR